MIGVKPTEANIKRNIKKMPTKDGLFFGSLEKARLHQKKGDSIENEGIYSQESLINIGTGYKHPPRFKWIPSRHLIRVSILRACYIKDVEKFIIDNTFWDVRLTLDGMEIFKRKLTQF